MFCWGCNRVVWLVGPVAVKLPRPTSWREILFGLLNNMNEVQWRHKPGACPVLFWLPGGTLVVMARATPISETEFARFDWAGFCQRTGLRVEPKPDSFGIVRGKIVAVDYGW